MEAAGKNDAGAMTGFMGMGMGMNANGTYLSQAAQNNQEQINQQQAEKQNQQAAQGNEKHFDLSCLQHRKYQVNSARTVVQQNLSQTSNQNYK